jgi:2'-5' RNA ligase
MDLSDAVRASIIQFIDVLRKSFPNTRWVRPEGIHVTLKFIGELGEERVPGIKLALGEILSPAPVDLTFHGVGFFPSERRPRVFWVGIDYSANLVEIAAEIESRLEPLGIARETREFRPHLTLARFDDARGIEKLHSAIQQAGATEFGHVRSSEFHLYESQLSRGGAKYTKLSSFSFAPEAAA